MDLNGKRALVVGMKKSGMASAALLASHGAIVRATDLKPLAELPEEAGPLLERLGIPFAIQAPAVFESCDLIVLSPDVPADLAPLAAARARGVRVIGEVELAAPFLEGRSIGITGSNGKTTTTSLIGQIRRARAGGREYRKAGHRHDRNFPRGWLERARAFELPTGND